VSVEITFVRHGESESNVTGHWQGQGDSPLSPHGREQATKVGARLANERFDVVISSDLSRAADTARAAAAHWDATLSLDPAWREIDVGRWEGLTRDEVAEKFPEEIEALAGGQMVKIGGAESWADLAARVSAALRRLKDGLEPGQRAIVFAHGGVITSIMTAVLGVGLRKPRRLGNVNNTSVTTVRFDGDDAQLLRYNDTSHLGPLGKWGSQRLADGATVVRLLPEKAVALPRTYALGGLEGERLDVPGITEALAALTMRHPKEHVGLRTTAASIGTLANEILGAAKVSAPMGVTHVVASDRGHTLADYNCVG